MAEPDRKKALADMKRGLRVALSFSINDALCLMEQGRIENARTTLEDALRYACAIDYEVMEVVGMDSVRPGKGVK